MTSKEFQNTNDLSATTDGRLNIRTMNDAFATFNGTDIPSDCILRDFAYHLLNDGTDGETAPQQLVNELADDLASIFTKWTFR